jgi:amino acid adenylation domain-containing protein
LSGKIATLPRDQGGGLLDCSFEPFSEAALDGSIIDRFDATAARYADRLAVSDENRSLNYSELSSLRDRIAAAIACATGDRPGPVAILLRNEARYPAAMLGVLASGRAFVPLNGDHPIERNRRIAACAKAVALVSAEDLAANADALFLPDLATIDIDRLVEDWPSPRPRRPKADDLAYIIYTSGSTGAPKGVYQNHRGVLHDVLQTTQVADLGCEDRLALFNPPSLKLSVRVSLAGLLNGGSLHCLVPGELTPSALANKVQALRITVLWLVPRLLGYIAEGLGLSEKLNSVRVVSLGGDRVNWHDFDVFRRACSPHARLSIRLGATECGGIAEWFVDERLRSTSQRLPVGRAYPDLKLMIVDDEGRPVADGGMGEIHVTSPYVALGYWQDPDLTASVFATVPADSGMRTCKTGDLAVRRPDGLIEYIGRKGQQIKLNGQRIELGEVESALASCHGVRDAAIVVRRDENGVARLLAAYCELEPAVSGLLPHHLSAALAESLPLFMLPGSITILSTLPRLPNFKIDREELRRRDQLVCEHALAAQPSSQSQPHTETQRRLLALWREVLKREDVGYDDNFFLFGGDSLSAIDLIHRIEKELQHSLPLKLLIEAPTVRQLEGRLGAATLGAIDNTIHVHTTGSQRALFAVGGIHGTCLHLYPVFRSLGLDQPCHGLQPPGMDWASVGCATLQDMAAHYVGVMQAVQPHGPYRLLGDSFGGLVVYEMALQLQMMGEQVEFLAMLDTSPPAILDYDGANVEQPPLIEMSQEQNSMPAIVQRLFEAQSRARRNYVLDSRLERSLFRGELTYFLATGEPIVAKYDRRRLWQRFARGGFRLLLRPGTHGWPRPQYTVVPALLRSCLNGEPLNVSDPETVFDRTYQIKNRAHCESILSSTGDEYCIDKTATQGSLDTFTADSELVQFAGWAVEHCQQQPAQTIAVFLGDRFLGYGASGTPRPDLAQYLPPTLVEHAGFYFVFRRAAVVGRTERPRLFVLSSNGHAAELQGAWLQDGEKLQGGGVNLLEGVDEKSMYLAGARIELDNDKGLLTGEGVFRLVTNGESGEHYAVLSWAAPVAGQTIFSIYVRRSSTAWVRLQLLDDSVNGLIVDYALASDAYRATRVGKATKLDLEVDKSGTDWRRIAVSASLPAATGKIIIQLADPTGSSNFARGDVSLLFQAPMVEVGGTASAWCRPVA